MYRPRIALLGLMLTLGCAALLACAATSSAVDTADSTTSNAASQTDIDVNTNTDTAAVADPAAPVSPATTDDAADQTTPATPPAPTDRANTLTLAINRSDIVYGQSVTASGSLAPAGVAPLTIERWTGSAWVAVATDTTDASGDWSTSLAPTANWTIRARLDDNSATTSSRSITVSPRLTITRKRRGTTFVGIPIRATVQPASYRGKITFAVRYAGRVRDTARFRPRNGRLRIVLPAPGYGRMSVRASLPARNSMSSGASSFSVTARHPTIRQGSRGAAVRGLVARLRELRFHTPSTSTFDYRMGDVILAFHKSQRMHRTKKMSQSTWRKLTRATALQPRYRSYGDHIEVNKTRQILMVVKNGKVRGTIHVSTGATGNTPVGRWRVYQKGGSHLFKFMAFVGNFGIHGYVPVPTYPASHGCVREPMWAAAWTYGQTSIGDRVIIYR